MTSIEVKVTGTLPQIKLSGALTSGMVGVPVTFSFGPEWEGLNKIAVFKGCTVKTRALVGANETTVPHEVLLMERTHLEIGVEGRKDDGSLVYPSVMARAGVIQQGADASADPGSDPSPTVYDDIMRAIGKLDSLKTETKESLVAAINELYEKDGGGGEIDPAYIEQLVNDYLAEHPPEPGAKGDKGDPGYTPVKGTDYYTKVEKEELIAEIEQNVTGDIDTALDSILAIQATLIGGDGA